MRSNLFSFDQHNGLFFENEQKFVSAFVYGEFLFPVFFDVTFEVGYQGKSYVWCGYSGPYKGGDKFYPTKYILSQGRIRRWKGVGAGRPF